MPGRRLACGFTSTTHVVLLAAGVLTSYPAWSQPCPDNLTAAEGFASDEYGVALVAGDLDLDGAVDVALTTYTAILAFPGNGDGTLGAPQRFPTGQSIQDFALGNIDSGPVPDLVVASDDPTAPYVGVLLGNGSGGFGTPTWHYPGGAPTWVVLADLDADLDTDIVAGNSMEDRVAVLLGDGNGGFAAAVTYPAGEYPRTGATGDFDEDGAVDIVAGLLEGGGSLALLRGNGDGTFGAPSIIPVGDAFGTVIAAHLDGDAHLDLATSSIAVLLGTGTGAFQPPSMYPRGSGAEGLAVADVDRDGDADLLAAGGDVVAVLLGRGDGTFDPPAEATMGQHTNGVAVADMDRDSVDDAVTLNLRSETVSIARGRGDGSFVTAVATTMPSRTSAEVAGDVDGDGITDLVCADDRAPALIVMAGNGDGTFRAGPPMALGDLSGAIGADLDGNGTLDLADAISNDTIRVLRGTGAGGFQDIGVFPSGVTPWDIVAAMVDDDGLLDLVVRGPDQLAVLLSAGGGTFQPPVMTSYGLASSVGDLLVADLDGDGWGDAAVATDYDPHLRVLLGNGDGTFQPPVAHVLGDDTEYVAGGDLDGDGDLDLVAGEDDSSSPELFVLHGAGDGTFGTPATYPYPAADVAIDDFTRDGTPDVVAVADAGLCVLAGNGDGTLQPPRIWSVGTSAHELTLIDLDADAVVDALVDQDYVVHAVLTERIAVLPPALPDAVLGSPYTAMLTAARGTPPYAFSLGGGALPAGLSLSPSGAIGGTPMQAGTFSFLVEVQDAAGCTALRSYALAVRGTVAFLAGQGHGPPNENRVVVHATTGSPTGVDFLAYGAGQWGTNVAAGDVDGGPDEIFTGPGPGSMFGPQVRGFQRDGTPIAKVSFYAYGTLRYGVNVASGRIDAATPGAMVTAPGPGEVFGPHVRAFALGAAGVEPVAKVSFFAYSTLRFGANAAGGDVDQDGFAEIVTGPGAGIIFSPHVRGFDYDGVILRSIPGINFNAFGYQGFGAFVAAGDVDADGFDELGAAPGPGPSHPAAFQGFDVDGGATSAIPGFAHARTPTLYGGRLALGDVDEDLVDDLITGLGPDPSAASDVLSLRWDGAALVPLGNAFLPFPGTYGVNVASGALAGQSSAGRRGQALAL